MDAPTTPARRLWQALEPLHAIVYFHAAPADAATALGLKGWWMGYFAGRFAPPGRHRPAAPVQRLGEAGLGRALELALPLSRHLVDGGAIPVPNPIGAPRP